MKVISLDLVQEILSDVRAQYNLFDPNEMAGYDATIQAMRRISQAPYYWIETEEDL